ncbi:MAG: putative Ig domain-containing protein [Nitrospirota bacterium]
MRDALFFSKLRVLLCGWRWKHHRRASWLKARLRHLRHRLQQSSRTITLKTAPPRSSPFLLEPLEARLLLAADLTGVVQSAALIDPAVPTNSASAVVQVQNIGNQRVNQSQVGVYASLDSVLDSSDLLLGTANTDRVNAGASKNVTVNLTLSSTLNPVPYTLLSKFDNANAITESSESNNVAIGGTINGTWKFGAVPGRAGNTTLTLSDADGTRVTFSLSGPGTGEVIKDGSTWDVKITGTTASSVVTILTNSGGNGRVTLNDVHVFGPLSTFLAATTDLTGTLAIDGPVNIPGLLPGTITLGSIQGGTIAVPSVEALTILGSTTNAKIYVGATLGQDGQPGGTGANADMYGAGSIGLFTVTGAMSGTSVRVGIDPVDGAYSNGNDTLIGGTSSSIGGIVIGGALSADTRFYAGRFPTQYLNGLTLKPTAGDVHFVSNFSGPALTASLQQDTGSSASDQLTSNPAITGSLTDPQGIATFLAGFGATPTVNVLSDRQPDGSFSFTQVRLEQINGAPLTDGTYVLKLQATDTAGNSTQISVPFTLDTQVSVLTFDLAAASDTAPLGDQQTTNDVVTLIGQTEALATVHLLETGATTQADASGNFSFTNVALNLGANTFTVRATDAAGNQRTESRTITRVAAGNNAPVLNAIGPQTVNEGATLTFTATASDPNAGQTVTFSLENGATGQVPVGASIDPVTGAFTWTPTEAQGPGTFTFDVVVTDTGSPNLTDRETITVTVNEVNLAPVVTAVADQTLDEGTTLALTLTATDTDLPANQLTWSLTTAPAGASIDLVTGVLTWTPTEAQGPGSYSITARATDNGSPILFGETTFTVTVNEVNLVPVLTVPVAVSGDEQTLLTFAATATDADLLANQLTFSLQGTVPAGASIDPTTGAFTWTPTETQGPGTYNVTVRVTDNGSPSLFSEQAVQLTVNEVNLAPTLAAIPTQTVTAGQLLTFTAVSSDADLPANTLTYGLQGTIPTGASIDPSTGVFTWIPTAGQVGAHSLIVRVTDNGTPGLFAEQAVAIMVEAQPNQAPVLNPIGNQTVDELTELRFTISGSDVDVPAQTLVFSATGLPIGASFDSATREFAWTPTEAQGHGTYDVTFSVTDGIVTTTETVTITVNEVNSAPTLDPIGNRTIDEGTELRFTLSASDTDLPIQALIYGASGLPTGATFNTATREFAWTPSEGQGPGTYDITFSVTDSFATASETITITVNEVNVAPVLEPIGNKSVIEETELRFTIGGSDVDVPAQTLVYSATGLPAGATFDPATREFVWTPTDTQGPNTYDVIFSVTDGVVTTSELITITVTEVNQAPVLNPIGNQNANEGQPLTFTAIATDADVPTQPLTFSLENGVGGAVPVGATINPTTGAFSWTPTEAQGPGSYTFDVVVMDNGTPNLSDRETITVTVAEVNQAPTLTVPAAVSGDEQSLLTFTATATDADLPTNSLTFSLQGTVPAGASIDPVTGVFTWTPTEAQGPGIYNITVRVTDDGSPSLFSEQTVQLTIGDVNQTPTFTSSPTVSVQENQMQVITVTASDADVPVQPLIYSPAGGADAALFAITSGGLLSFVTAPNFEAPSDANLDNVYEVTVQVSDGAGGIATQTVNVTVTNVTENIPTLSINDVTLVEGTSLSGTTAFNFTVALSEAINETVTVRVATVDNGATAASGDYTPVPLTTLTFGPNQTEQTVTVQVRQDDLVEGDEQFVVQLSNATNATIVDSQGLGTITNDDAVNQPPALNLIGNQTIDEGQPLTFTATATDADSPANTLTFTLENGAGGSIPAGASIDPTTGVFTWTPTEAQGPGTYTFDVVVSDGTLSDSEPITVTVGEVNQAPTLSAIPNQTVTVGQTITFTAVGTDADLPSNALTYSLEGLFSAGATIDPATGVFTWTPTAAQVGGPHGFTVRVTDNGTPNLFAEQIVQVTVEPTPNQSPVLNPIGNQTIDEGQQLTFVANATDPDGLATFTFSLDNGLSGQVPLGASIAGGTGQLTWTPTEAQGSGTYTFDVVVTDNGTPALSDRETITVTVNEVNQAPTLQAIPNQTVTAGQLLSFTAVGSDADIPANGLTYSLQGVVPAGATIDPTTGNFTWTPTNAQVGPQSVTVRVTDNDVLALFAEQVVSITVNAQPNQAPVLNTIGNQSVNEGEPLTFTATATDADIPAQGLTFSLEGTVPTGATIDPTTGVFTWTPTEAQGPGSFTFDVVVTDNGTPILSDRETITVTVGEVNQAPVLNPIGNQAVDEGQQLTMNVTAQDPDGPGLTTFTFTLENGVSGQVPLGASIAAGTGQLTWTPTEAQGPGTYTFDVVVTDNGTPALNDRETIVVTVGEVNQAPTLQAIPNQTVTAGQLLTFGAVGADPDIPANGLTYSLDLSLLPPGFGTLNTPTIDPTSGVFNWTPAEGQVGTHQITVRVTDNGTGALFAEQPVQVTVAIGNQAPVLSSVGNRTVTVGQQLTFTATATDADVPAQSLTFSLQGTPPSGASITTGGVFTWTPAAGQVGAHSVTIRVTDNGAPALFDEETITITVAAELAVSFQGLGDLPGGTTASFAAGISADGNVVVGVGNYNNGFAGEEAFRWTSAAGIVGLGDLPGSIVSSFANDVSADGAVVVGSSQSAAGQEAFRWTASEGMVGLGDFATGSFSSQATAVSADGSVVVGTGDPGPGPLNAQAFRWTSATGLVALGALPSGGSQGNEAFDVSADGTVIVGRSSNSSGVGTEAFRWTNATGMVGLGGLLGAIVDSEALAVSADSTVVVGLALNTNGQDEAFRWTASGGMVGLGMLPGDNISVAFEVSGDGSLVLGVSGFIGGTTATSQPFIWDAVNGMRSLTSLLAADVGLGTSLAGWALNNVTGVSVDGRVIVGNGTNPTGQREAWRAVLPAVLPVNEAPLLSPIGNQNVNEGATLTFTASATDSSPYQSLTFILQGTIPAGAAINPTTGVFTWMPTEAQGPGTYTFDVAVRDNSANSLSDSETITVTVNEINQAPTLATIPNQIVTAGQLLIFTAAGGDADLPANTLTYSLEGTVPVGAAINPTTGEVSWTPTFGQVGSHNVTVRVMDDGTPNLFAEQVVTITVAASNVAPVLTLIGDQAVTEGQLVTFFASATDADVPAQTLTFSLQGTLPSGASIDPQTGQFAWITSAGQAGGYSLTIRVTDNGAPALFSEQAVNVTVLSNAASFQGLGDLPGGIFSSRPFGVSGNGAVVVGESEGASGPESFRWTVGGGIENFSTVVGVPVTARAASLDGSVIVGDSSVGVFRWSQTGGIQTIVGNTSAYSGNAVSSDGLVVVGKGQVNIFTPQGAFRWTAATGAVRLDSLAGYADGEAFGISAGGNVIVGANYPFFGSQEAQAVRWVADGLGGFTVEGLGDLPGGNVFSRALAVSSDGSVIVGVSESDLGMEVFRWTVTGGMQGLGIQADAVSVSADGSTVLAGQDIWDENNGARNLESVMSQLGVPDLAGWSGLMGLVMTGDGRTIVGTGTNPLGDQEAWRAVLPENLFAPQYAGSTSFSGQADNPLTFRLNLFAPDVSDQDSATQQFQVRLIGNVPAGATLDPFGFFSWTPTTSDIGVHQLTVRLYDNGVPSRFSEFQIDVTVTA